MKETDLLQDFYERLPEPLYKQLGLVEYFLEESFWEPVINSEKKLSRNWKLFSKYWQKYFISVSKED